MTRAWESALLEASLNSLGNQGKSNTSERVVPFRKEWDPVAIRRLLRSLARGSGTR